MLTSRELRHLRNGVEKVANDKGVSQHWSKSQINAAGGAIESRWDAVATQTALSDDIEAAAPGVFNVAEKKYLAAFWLVLRGKREKEAI